MFSPRVEIPFYFFLVTEIIRDGGIDVGKPEGRKLLDDLLCRGAVAKGGDNAVQRDPGTGDADYPIGI